MADFVSALVAVPTENPPGRNYRACADLLARHLDRLGFPHEVVEVPTPAGTDPRFCVLSGYGTGRTLYFHGHYDVVPASSPEQFTPRRQGVNLFGRGATDMKSGLASMLYAVLALRELGVALAGRIGLVFVPDEETGGAFGSRWLAETGRLGRDGIGMLTAEPTGGVVWNANRGAISLRVTVRGKPAHVGLQHRGVNAFEGMLEVAAALRQFKRAVERRKTRFRIAPEAARRSILMLGGQVSGGTNFNVVPAECAFTVERRFNPEEDLAAEKRKLLAVFDRLRRRGVKLDVEIFQEGRAAGFSEREPLAQALAESVRAVTGRAPKFEMCPGLLEIRFYGEQGMPAFAYGPGLLSVAHGPNEFVPLANVSDCAAVYALTAAKSLARQPK